MCLPALAAIPAIIGAMSSAAGVAAGTAGTFLGISAATWGGIAAASTVAGAAVSAIGMKQQGDQQAAAYKQQAKLDDQRALDAQRRGSIAEGEQRTNYQRFVGSQRAAMGGSGTVVDELSSGDVLAETVGMGERDAQRLRVNAEREAWGYASEATNNRFQAGQARAAGTAQATQTFLGGTMNAFRGAPWYKTAWSGSNTFAPNSYMGNSSGLWGG